MNTSGPSSITPSNMFLTTLSHFYMPDTELEPSMDKAKFSTLGEFLKPFFVGVICHGKSNHRCRFSA
jgi:hypothetical protein